MEFRKVGSGKSLYWVVAILSFETQSGARVEGTYLLDTGGKAIVSKQILGPEMGMPRSIGYGSGLVVGYEQDDIFLKNVLEDKAKVKVLHRVFKFPFHESIDGILGLCPGSNITEDWGLRSVEFDFRASQVHFNKPKIFPGKCQTVRHWYYPQRPWLRSTITLRDTRNQEITFKDVWIFCDTGATKALTFFNRIMTKLGSCEDRPQLKELVLHDLNIKTTIPVNSFWPVCVPNTDRWVHSVIMGIQALESLRAFSYEITPDGQVVNVCLTA